MAGSLCVLVKRFPKLSETFVEGEIASLIAAGLAVEIASLYRPSDDILHPSSSRFDAQLTYLDRYGLLIGIALLVLGVARGGRRALGAVWAIGSLEPRLIARLARLLVFCHRHRIEHIHAHCASEPALLAEAAMLLGGPTFSFTAHAKDLYLCPRSILQRLVAAAEFATTCTRHNFRYLQSCASRPNVHLVYHGIDTHRFAPRPESARGTALQLISVGRLKEKKGFDVLIEACERLRDRGTEFSLRIYGYGDQRACLQAQLERGGLERHVTLMPPVTHAQLPCLLANADVFALPCRVLENGDRDGIPNAMLEAMAVGLGVVSTSVSGITEAIRTGINGILVPSGDPDALADALYELSRNHARCKELGRRARATVVQRFSWERNIKTLVELLSVAMARDAQPLFEGGAT